MDRSDYILKNEDRFDAYLGWVHKNKYFGKKFSILGDSISTLKGYNPEGYNLFYTGDTCERSGVKDMKDTWWGKVIDYFGGELLVNNSWSGSRVTKIPKKETLFPSGCSDERTGGLHMNTVMPDVIIVYMGINDWACGTQVEEERKGFQDDRTGMCVDGHIQEVETVFSAAYKRMLDSLKRNYPDAEIFCCTMNETYMASNPAFAFPCSYGGIHINRYNNAIRRAASQKSCSVIDLSKSHLPYDAVDGTHPTETGMQTLAALMLRGMCDREGLSFLECACSEHEFITAEEYTGGTKYVCRKCGLVDRRIMRDIAAFAGRYAGSAIDGRRIAPVSHIPQPELKEQKIQKTDGVQMKVSNDNLIGQIVSDKYELIEPLGREVVFQVYLAKDRFNTNCAVKVCDKNMLVMNDTMRNFLLQEPYLIMKFNHPAIPKIFDIYEDDQYLFVIREYIEGDTLSGLLIQNRPFDEKKVVDLGIRLADVLHYLHTLHPPCIYRDMKPANVMLTTSGDVKFIDFGTVMEYNPEETRTIENLGTKGYAAPEQYGSKVDIRADIYGLGVTLHQLITGIKPNMPPYEAPPICQVNPALSKGLEYIICKCVNHDPDDRYQTCAELIADLRNYQSLPPKKGLFANLFSKKK